MKDSPLMKKPDPDEKRVKELSAKEQESGRKFKEKFNKLKKIPMPPQPTINVNSEGLTEGELTIEKLKRKFKQAYSKYFKEPLPSAAPELEKTVRKNLESTLCKSVGGMPEQMVLIAKNKLKNQDTREATEKNEQIVLPPKTKENLRPLDKTEPIPQCTPIPTKKIEEFILALKNNEKSLDSDLFKPTNLAPPDASTRSAIASAGKIVEPIKHEELKQPIYKANNVRGGILSSILKNFEFVTKLFLTKFRFSDKNIVTKNDIPVSLISKIPLRWRQGFVILGTIIPFYYTYHKIVTGNKLSTIRISEEY